MKSMLLAAAAVLFVAVPAQAQVVDGNYDAAYGVPTATVFYDASAPDSNFGSPTRFSNAVGYDIYMAGGTSSLFGYFQARPALGGSAVAAFANLYFDLDPAAANGSDLGFEIGANGVTAFVPGRNGQPGFNTLLDASSYAVFASGNIVEFSLANSLFTAPINGLNYYDGQTFPASGQPVVLRLSQSFGYSVAGGANYGENRLGAINIGGNVTAAVPEPATWAMMIAGFGLVGGAMRRRRVSVAFA